MHVIHDLAYLFGGVFLANAVPHFVSGMMGRSFQSPFANPPGKGLSSSCVNVIWGFVNFLLAYLLLAQVGHFNLRNAEQALSAGLGILLMGLYSAYSFGRFHGGNLSSHQER
ncbi:MAG: hypothetical protein QM578_10855 [Pantoea sp.]|uniref:hypothetical protein n=1 Tax=Pantoea sp. TaxID=69393 RepID=UPI0039E356F1